VSSKACESGARKQHEPLSVVLISTNWKPLFLSSYTGCFSTSMYWLLSIEEEEDKGEEKKYKENRESD
jgi:hypothetical protein